MECENCLFIYLDDGEKKDYFIRTLNTNDKLFEAFIPLFESKLECYGTSSDVYIEYIDVDFLAHCISLTFYTYETPCIEFCKKLASRYNFNIELKYYNELADFAGKLQIYRNQIVKECYGYLQGIYFNKKDKFWELIYSTFNSKTTFIDFFLEKRLKLNEDDFNKLKQNYDEFLLCSQFKIL
jgi:hypothetical protein